MTAKEIYERIHFDGSDMPEQKFCEYLTEAISHTISKFGDKYVLGKNGTFSRVVTFEDDIDVLEDYAPCLAAYVKFLNGDERAYEMYLLLSDTAYKNVWRRVSKGHSVKVSYYGER